MSSTPRSTASPMPRSAAPSTTAWSCVTGDIESGFLEVCRPSFPYKELVRIFPTGTTSDEFGFSADTVFVTERLPGSKGTLVVESCRWSLDRITTEAPEIETCPSPPSARP